MKPPTVAESTHARKIGREQGGELRKRAALRIRCGDCDGVLLATVTWVDGRPLAAARERGDRLAPERAVPPHWAYTWADRGTVLHAWPRGSRHRLLLADVLDRLPANGKPRRNLVVRHADSHGLARP